MMTTASGRIVGHKMAPMEVARVAEALDRLEHRCSGQLGLARSSQDLHFDPLAPDVVVEGHQQGETGSRSPVKSRGRYRVSSHLLLEPVLGPQHHPGAGHADEHSQQADHQAGSEIGDRRPGVAGPHQLDRLRP